MRAWLFAFFLVGAFGSLSQGQSLNLKFVDGLPVPYSNMSIVEEEGDFVGWDLRVMKLSDTYTVTLFCGEGEIQGPVHATFRLKDGVAVIHPNNTVCGDSLEFRFEARGVRVKVGDSSSELVPQHKNFIKEERWK
jgi:hypothetical protein